MPLISSDPRRPRSEPAPTPNPPPHAPPEPAEGKRRTIKIGKRRHEPGLVEAASDFARSAARSLKVLPERSAAGQAHCWSYCRSCELRFERNGRQYCGKPYLERLGERWKTDAPDNPGCGCNLDRKIRDPKSKCPEGNWGPEPPRPGAA